MLASSSFDVMEPVSEPLLDAELDTILGEPLRDIDDLWAEKNFQWLPRTDGPQMVLYRWSTAIA